MKKYLSLTVLLCSAFALCLTGCGKDKKAESETPVEPEVVIDTSEDSGSSYSEAPASDYDPEAVYTSAVSIYSNAGVYVEDRTKENKLRWVGSLTKGQWIIAEGTTELKEYPKNFVNDKEGAKPTVMARIFVDFENEQPPVNGNYYYVVKDNIVIGTRPFVVVGDNILGGQDYTYVYTAPDLKKITKFKIPTGTLLAVHDYDGPSDSHEFYCVTCYVSEGESKGLWKNKYVEARAITDDENFLRAAMTGDKLRTTKDLKPEVEEAVYADMPEPSSSELAKFMDYVGAVDGR